MKGRRGREGGREGGRDRGREREGRGGEIMGRKEGGRGRGRKQVEQSEVYHTINLNTNFCDILLVLELCYTLSSL